MNEIFEQKKGEGIGLSVDDFLRRFGEICITKPSSKFALILYDFDSPLKKVLRERGAFAAIDRLSAERLTVFYLHSTKKRDHQRLKKFSASHFGPDTINTLPCIIFFSVLDAGVSDVIVSELQASESSIAFHEIYQLIEAYANSSVDAVKQEASKSIGRSLSSAGKTVLTESLRILVRDALAHFHL